MNRDHIIAMIIERQTLIEKKVEELSAMLSVLNHAIADLQKGELKCPLERSTSTE